jgi:GNAT superfamily N-acetyltransferase
VTVVIRPARPEDAVGLADASRDLGQQYRNLEPAHQGQGIGGRLLRAVEEWAQGRGAELLLTDTNFRSNLGALEFYESHGFEEQAVILRKRLA